MYVDGNLEQPTLYKKNLTGAESTKFDWKLPNLLYMRESSTSILPNGEYWILPQ